MQISQVTKEELALLIHGLRVIHVATMEDTRCKLVTQLESELSTRFGMAVGSPEEQERNRIV